eukprot:CAMPEP_0185803312 /NCGR_PEP_ID=MMETSP1322-20130828/2555_1 /TAXON_ID=265543 /ORGANISM="Minutocellus polymorphus, Strain RCC2270" /LENGTH=121 /DNA_ID=CAMNT_0028499179 /DNA_START=349 /DNA_END=713 /DNA_ORIENTATION=-
MNRPIPLTIPGMLLLHAKGPQRKEQRPGTEDSQAWLPAGSLVGPGIGEHDDRAAEKAWAGKKSEKSAGVEAKEILERDPDPLLGQTPPAQTVQALLGGGPLGPGLGSSAESTPRVDHQIPR